MIWSDLTKAFDGPLYDFGQTNGIAVFLENIDAPTTADTPWLSGFMLPAVVEQADLSVTEFRNGIYQIDINYPQNNGSKPINAMADLLNQTFKTGASFSFGEICAVVQSFEMGPLIVSNGWATRSVSVNWHSYTMRL